MSDALDKAEAAAREAAVDTDMVRIVAAVLAAQQATQPQPQQPAPARRDFNPGQWLVIGGVVVSVGLAAALFAVAIAIGATCATVCLLILRAMWRDLQKGK